MKKMLFIAALAIGMVGCTNEEDVVLKDTATPVLLNGVAKKTTRGGLDQNKLTDLTNIYCSGLHHATAGTTAFHFLDATFQTAGSETWSGGNAILWPMDGTIDFWAYTSADYTTSVITDAGGSTIGMSTTTENNVKPTATFNVDPSTKKYSNLVLDFTDKLQGATDVMYSKILDDVACSGSHGVQELTFSHAMAWIVVNISPSAAASDDWFKFYSISLNNVKLSGKLTVDPSTSPYTQAWIPYPNASTPAKSSPLFPAYGQGSEATGVTFGDATKNKLNGILVLPQDRTSITITYSYKNASTGAFDNPSSHTIDLNIPAETWEAGKKYVYTITFDTSDKSIKFTSSVESYESGIIPGITL